jgi:hypothetical protein
VRSFDDYDAAYVAWFWHVVSAAATAIGRAGASLQWGANRRRDLLLDFGLKAAQAVDIAGRNGYRFRDLYESQQWRALDDHLLRPEAYEANRESNTTHPSPSTEISQTAKRRGRRPNPERRDAIREAISKHGDQWRDHLPEIFAELDGEAVSLGDFQAMRINLGDDESQIVTNWEDLDLAVGDQRARIIDTLRKYV